MDTYEGKGTLSLTISRSVGSFGAIEVSWQAIPREAGTEDFKPSGGVISFTDGQLDSVIQINIIDDDITENLETFDVQLVQVVSGGAGLGEDRSVRVGIIRNDSPNGVFSFLDTKVSASVEFVGSSSLLPLEISLGSFDRKVYVKPPTQGTLLPLSVLTS